MNIARRKATVARSAHQRHVVGLLLACAFALYTTTTGADVRARIEPRIVDELETAHLILRTEGTTIETPDLAPLAGDFEVLGTQTASQYQSVNGVVEAWVEYQITLRPTSTGELTIPPLTVGGETSAPLTLEVRGIDPQLRAAIDRMVFFEVEVTRNPVYVRSETVLVRRLYYSDATQIYSDLPGPPELPTALVVPIGETRSGSVERDGTRYGVIEQRFALFPERSGGLTIPPVSLTSSVRLQVDGRVRRSGARIKSAAVPIEVLPIPAEYPANAPWLPATKVDLTNVWKPERPRYNLGEPIERIVEIRVSGNLAAAITPPDAALPEAHFRQYPEPAAITDDRSGASVVGRLTTQYAIIPTAPGTVQLPALAVTWWDVEQGKVRVTRIDSRQVLVEALPGAAAPAPSADATATDASTAPELTRDEPSVGASTLPALLRTVALGAAIVLILFGFWRGLAWLDRHRASRAAATGTPTVTTEATSEITRATTLAQTLARAVGQSLTIAGLAGDRRGLARRLRLRALMRALRAAGRSADGATVQAALVRYLCCWYATTPVEATQRFRAAGGGALLDRLQAGRFGRDPGGVPAAAEIIAALRLLKRPRPPLADPLPELYARR